MNFRGRKIMKYSIEGGDLPVVRIYLERGETVKSEAGGRTWALGAIHMEQTSDGGAMKALGRMFSGESLFLTKYTAMEDAEIAFASSFPGKIIALELSPGETVIAQKQAYLASTESIDISMYFQQKIGAGFFGGEGFIMQKFTGPGLVFFEIDGYAVEYDLAAGQKLVCDTGVLALMASTCSIDIQMVKGLKNIVFGGEGLFDTTITGPGRVYLQSMNIAGLSRLLIPHTTKG